MNKAQTDNLELYDIKDIVSIPDNSIFFFIGLIIALILLVAIMLISIINYFKNRKISTRKRYYITLENIDFKNPKKAAYTITKYARLLATTNTEKKLASELIENLEKYKYKKVVSSIDNKTKAMLSTFLDVVDV
ncbi:MAG: hypothetical protein ACQERD_00140 [Campylobacterota bacterium]